MYTWGTLSRKKERRTRVWHSLLEEHDYWVNYCILHTNIDVTECLNKVINNLTIYNYDYVIVL